MTRLETGTTAPDFTLPDDTGAKVSLSDFRGKKVILYVYPAAMTPGCTTQACDFRDSLEPLAAAGYAVIGISPDSPEKLAAFRQHDGLTFPLVSDEDKSVLEAYGAWGEKHALRQDRHRRDPLDLRDRRGRHDRQGDVQRQSHRPRGQAPPRPRRLRAPGTHSGCAARAYQSRFRAGFGVPLAPYVHTAVQFNSTELIV